MLLRCGEFMLPGIAKLVVQQRKRRMGRNPATGARVEIQVLSDALATIGDVKARRFAPPPLRGADGLDVGSAHARPDWLLPTMPTHTPLHVVVAVLSRMTPFPATVDI